MHTEHEQWIMKAGEKDYLKESNGTKANCNTNVMQVLKSRIYISYGHVAVTQDASLRTTQLPCLYVLRLGLFPHRLWKDSASCSRLSLKRLCRLFCASLIRYFLLPSSSWAVSGPWLTSISSASRTFVPLCLPTPALHFVAPVFRLIKRIRNPGLTFKLSQNLTFLFIFWPLFWRGDHWFLMKVTTGQFS